MYGKEQGSEGYVQCTINGKIKIKKFAVGKFQQ